MSQRRYACSSSLGVRVMRAGLVPIAIALMLGACGGGGSDAGGNSAPPSGSPANPGTPGTPATTLTVPPVQVQQQGESYSLTFVSATTGNTYKWQRSSDGGQTWNDVGGSFTTPTALTFEADQLSMNGLQYRLHVSNGTDSASSTPFILTVAASVPTIHSQPQDQSVRPGAEARFVIGAYGASRSYRWQRSADAGASWQDIAGEVSASLTLSSVAPELTGHLFRVVVTTNLGSVTSTVAVLTVQTAPTTIASAYVLHAEENKVTRFSIMSDGSVVAATTRPFSLPVFPFLVFLSPTSDYLAVHDGSNLVALPFDAQGELSHPWGLVRPAPALGDMAISPDGLAAYVLGTGRVSQYRFGSSGFMPLSPEILITRGMTSALVGPSGDWSIWAPIGGPDTQLLTLPIAADRTLNTSPISSVVGAGQIQSLALNATGSRLYAQAATGRVGQHILQFQVDANGALTPLSPPSLASVGNDHMLITRDGNCLFSPVIHKNTIRPQDGAIATFRIQDDGTLMPSTPAVQDVLRSLSGIAVTPDSRYLITVHASDNRLYVYRITSSCSLSMVGDFHDTGGMTPYGLVIR